MTSSLLQQLVIMLNLQQCRASRGPTWPPPNWHWYLPLLFNYQIDFKAIKHLQFSHLYYFKWKLDNLSNLNTAHLAGYLQISFSCIKFYSNCLKIWIISSIKGNNMQISQQNKQWREEVFCLIKVNKFCCIWIITPIKKFSW